MYFNVNMMKIWNHFPMNPCPRMSSISSFLFPYEENWSGWPTIEPKPPLIPGNIGIDLFRRAHWSTNILSSSSLESPAKSDSFYVWYQYDTFNMTVHFRPLKPSILTLLERSSRISHANSNIKLMPDKPKMPWTKLIKNKSFIFYIFWKMSQYMVAKTWSSSAF